MAGTGFFGAGFFATGLAAAFDLLCFAISFGMTILGWDAIAARRCRSTDGHIAYCIPVRGRFRSEGAWEPMRHEAEDGYDSVEWAAGLPGSSGAVGMFGLSYFGFTQWMAARAAPPHLKAIVPALTWALVLAVLVLPAHRRLEAATARPQVAALLSVLLTALLLVVPVALVGQRLVGETLKGADAVNGAVTSGAWTRAFDGYPSLARVVRQFAGQNDLPWRSSEAASGRRSTTWWTRNTGFRPRSDTDQ